MKLHALLAVASSHETQANTVRRELGNTFEKKRHLFEKTVVRFTPSAEGAEPVVEEQSELQTTVSKELHWVSGFIAKALDADYQIAEANMAARADIVLENGVTLAVGVPATSLLELQKRVTELLDFAKQVPTLDPAKGFNLDEAAGKDIYQARPTRKNRTKKVPKVFVRYEATPQHPAQTEMVHEDIITGVIEQQEWSGMMTPAQKSGILDRIEMVSRAVRAARAKANEQEVDTKLKIGENLLGFIFG